MVNITKQGLVNASGNGINENLLLNSATLTGKTSSYIDTDGLTVGVHTGTGSWNEAYWPISTNPSGNPLNGKVLTISMDFMVTDTTMMGNIYNGFALFNSSGGRIGDLNIAGTSYSTIDGSTLTNNRWVRIYTVFTCPSWTGAGATYRIQLKTNTSVPNTVSMYHKRIKVEMGGKPTPWLQAPADISNINLIHGFLENLTQPIATKSSMHMGESFVETTDFIEW